MEASPDDPADIAEAQRILAEECNPYNGAMSYDGALRSLALKLAKSRRLWKDHAEAHRRLYDAEQSIDAP